MLAANAWIVSSSTWCGLVRVGGDQINGKWCNDPGPGPDGISESSRAQSLRLVTIYGSSRV